MITEWAALSPNTLDFMCERPGDNNDNEADVMRAVATWMNDNAQDINVVGAAWFLAGSKDFAFHTGLYTTLQNPATRTCLGDEYFDYVWGQTP